MNQHLSSDSFRGNYRKRGIICELLNTLSWVDSDSALYKFTIDSRGTNIDFNKGGYITVGDRGD